MNIVILLRQISFNMRQPRLRFMILGLVLISSAFLVPLSSIADQGQEKVLTLEN